MLERHYQRDLIKRIRERMPDAVVLKNDPDYLQGVPDLLILHEDRWAMLEVKNKRPGRTGYQPNQEFWIEQFGAMSFASVIYPENEESVLDELQRSFASGGVARISER